MAIVVRDSRNAPLGAPIPKATSTTADQFEAFLQAWADPADSVSTGVWECTPGTFKASRDGYHEICGIISGSVTVTPDGGEPVKLGSGDLLVTPMGWTGTWEVHKTMRKLYVIVRKQ